ncbi:hypothetical protein EAG_09180 [Camponotus floridanus]|uniref:Uncharacterized protein n=1 Tax=Camponotus floridanus TaxID=104421 RepID=E2AKW0_CAMFO|nr:hypothetical protein EAG_09180 [Camponotus floridanus]
MLRNSFARVAGCDPDTKYSGFTLVTLHSLSSFGPNTMIEATSSSSSTTTASSRLFVTAEGEPREESRIDLRVIGNPSAYLASSKYHEDNRILSKLRELNYIRCLISNDVFANDNFVYIQCVQFERLPSNDKQRIRCLLRPSGADLFR